MPRFGPVRGVLEVDPDYPSREATGKKRAPYSVSKRKLRGRRAPVRRCERVTGGVVCGQDLKAKQGALRCPIHGPLIA